MCMLIGDSLPTALIFIDNVGKCVIYALLSLYNPTSCPSFQRLPLPFHLVITHTELLSWLSL